MKPKLTRKRLDQLLVERGIAESVQKALGMILAGEVLVDGNRQDKAGAQISDAARIDIIGRTQKYASRGGIKLEGALDDFSVSVVQKVCLDVGSSTGGFTDCLLQHGASKVYAVDVNMDQIAWKLHEDERVIRIERNARQISASDISELVDVVVADVSFISVSRVLGPAASVAKQDSEWLILIKPQFELSREEVGAGGIVDGTALHEKAIAGVRQAAETAGFECLGVKASRLTGAEGNQEYFLHARKKQ